MGTLLLVHAHPDDGATTTGGMLAKYADDVSNRSGARAEAHRLSAERAVDADLVECALERGELLIVELGDEQLGDAAHVDRSGRGEAGHAGVGQRDHDATPVGVGGASRNEALAHQAGHAAGHARA